MLQTIPVSSSIFLCLRMTREWVFYSKLSLERFKIDNIYRIFNLSRSVNAKTAFDHGWMVYYDKKKKEQVNYFFR